MPSVIVPSGGVTYAGQESNELLFAPLFKDPQLTDVFRVIDNIKSRRKMYVSPRLEKIVKPYAGCGWHPSNNQSAFNQKYIQVEPVEVQLEFCADDFDNIVFEELKKSGNQQNDITGTEIEDFILLQVTQGILRDNIRLALFDKLSYLGVKSGYGMVDGLWQQIFNGVNNYDIAHYSNSLGSAALGSCDAKTIYRAMIEDQSDELIDIDDADKLWLTPYSLWKNWKNCLQDTFPGSDLSWRFNQENDTFSVSNLSFDNIKLTCVRAQDRWIKADSLGNPYRNLLTIKDNIILGTDVYDDANMVSIKYNDHDDKVRIQARFKLGVQYVFGNLITAHY